MEQIFKTKAKHYQALARTAQDRRTKRALTRRQRHFEHQARALRRKKAP